MRNLKRKIKKFSTFPSFIEMKEFGSDIGVYSILKWLYDNGEYKKHSATLTFKNSSNTPIQNEIVKIKDSEGIEISNITDNQGKIVFSNLKVGTYMILVDNGVISPNTFTINIQDKNIDIDILYTPTYTATLIFKDRSNNVVPNLGVIITHIPYEYTGKTDAQGVVIFRGLLAYRYAITVSRGTSVPNRFTIVDQNVTENIENIT